MCRYGNYGPYRDHYACFACRKSFKWPHDRSAKCRSLPWPSCPECKGALEVMGLDFKAPPRTDEKQWMKVRILAEHGFRYVSCGCNGPGFRPAELREVEAFLAGSATLTAGEELLRKIDAYARRHREATGR